MTATCHRELLGPPWFIVAALLRPLSKLTYPLGAVESSVTLVAVLGGGASRHLRTAHLPTSGTGGTGGVAECPGTRAGCPGGSRQVGQVGPGRADTAQSTKLFSRTCAEVRYLAVFGRFGCFWDPSWLFWDPRGCPGTPPHHRTYGLRGPVTGPRGLTLGLIEADSGLSEAIWA